MIAHMRASLKEEREILRVKALVMRELAKLADDESRRRVVVATAALQGFPVCTKDEHLT